MTDFEYEVPLPGQFIQEELDARGWAQRDLAFILGMEETALNKIIKGRNGISLEMSRALGKALGVDEDFFANLQKTYDLEHTPAADPAIARRASLQNEYPVREMIRRGWLNNTEVGLLESQFKRFLKIENDKEVRQIQHAARKTNIGDDPTASQLAWLYRVVQIAESMPCKAYSEQALSQAKPKLKALMQRREGAHRVPQILADCGLRFVIVEGLPSGKIDGVCIWLTPDMPVVAMSIRFDRIDNFWFVLWHELGHVLKRHGKDKGAWIIDIDIELESDAVAKDSTIRKQEQAANIFAADQCVQEHEMMTFVSRRQYFAERDVVAFAHRMHVHPGIVVGQIHNRTKKYELLRKHQVKVREYIMPTATVDGWGHIASIGATKSVRLGRVQKGGLALFPSGR
jgi:HTH-type transcriptional regulator / antitoxin HigA